VHFCLFSAAHSYIGGAGVVPTPMTEVVHADEGDLAEVEELPPDHLAVNASSTFDNEHGAGVAQVQRRLREMSKPLAERVSHSYSAEAMLQFLDLASHLKNTSDMSSVLCCSAGIFFGNLAAPLQADLRNSVCHTPSLSLLRQGRLRLDYLSIMFQRQEFLRYDALIYIYSLTLRRNLGITSLEL
jgi:hypothetical protein